MELFHASAGAGSERFSWNTRVRYNGISGPLQRYLGSATTVSRVRYNGSGRSRYDGIKYEGF